MEVNWLLLQSTPQLIEDFGPISEGTFQMQLRRSAFLSTRRNAEDYMMMTGGICLIPGAYVILEAVWHIIRHNKLPSTWLLRNDIAGCIGFLIGMFLVIWLFACAGTLLWSGFEGVALKKVIDDKVLREAANRYCVENHDLKTRLDGLNASPSPPALSLENEINAYTEEIVSKVFPPT